MDSTGNMELIENFDKSYFNLSGDKNLIGSERALKERGEKMCRQTH